jgi:23S rRNA (guanosine2251-2'-O)-methyltransferase
MKRWIAGPRATMEALASRPGDVHVVYLADHAAPRMGELVALASKHKVVVETRPEGDLDAIAKGVKHAGVIAITGSYPYVSLDEVIQHDSPLVVVLDEITDPHNLGAIVRSAVCFGAHGIVTLRNRAAPVTPVVVRTSAGATEHAKISRVANLRQALVALQKAGYFVVGLDAPSNAPLSDVASQHPKIALVVGSEGHGLRRLTRETCDALCSIPMRGPLGSLNASVAAGVALYVCASEMPRPPTETTSPTKSSALPDHD